MLPPGQFSEVRYEELIKNPLEQMRRIYDELQLGDFEQVRPAMENYFAEQKDYKTNRYQISPELEKQITRRWRKYIAQYGYEKTPAADKKANRRESDEVRWSLDLCDLGPGLLSRKSANIHHSPFIPYPLPTMFSGIVEALGTVAEIRMEPPGCRLIVREPKIAADTKVADSICVNGCCLTVVEREGDTFGFPSRSGNARPHQSRRIAARQPGEFGAGVGRRRTVGRTFRQRAYRRRRHAPFAPRSRRLVHLLVLAAAKTLRANGLERLDRRRWREPDDRR